jgi:hypothetical protein
MKRIVLPALAVLAAAGSAPMLAAQDSVFVASAAGVNLLRLNNDAGLVVRGTAETGSIPATGAGVRMMWYPTKWAFRAGQVVSESMNAAGSYWDDSNVGLGSAAFGKNTRAGGDHSFAANLYTNASGDESVALGNNATASGDRALTFNGTASAVGAVAIGSGAQATNDDALALGPSSIAGGLASITLGPSIANGNFGVAIGLQNSASGQFSVAIGKNARTANRQGAIVIGDAAASFSSDSVYATANNQFVLRAAGGIRMITSANANPANVGTRGAISGVEVAAGGGSWSSISDRNRKENFLAIDGEEVLQRLRRVPVSSWNYKTQDGSIRHLGPMAQDFHAAFGLGESELLINTVDIDGINMAAAQALEVRTSAQAKRIEALEASNAALQAQNAELRARLERLEALLSAPAAQR